MLITLLLVKLTITKVPGGAVSATPGPSGVWCYILQP